MKAIINANIIMTDHVIPNGVILIEKDKIVDFGKAKDIKVPEGAEIIDAENNFVGPGLVDIHTHAAGGYYFVEKPEVGSKELLKHGVTSVMPALYYSLDKKNFVKAIEDIIDCYKRGEFENFIGFYMEGPYLNPGFGCDQSKNSWRFGVDREDYLELIEKSKQNDLSKLIFAFGLKEWRFFHFLF